jgi:hypothetical protein
LTYIYCPPPVYSTLCEYRGAREIDVSEENEQKEPKMPKKAIKVIKLEA